MICKKLATDATLNEVLCICSGRRPVETCTEGLAYKGPGCGVVPAESGMDFSQKVSSFFFEDTPLQDSGCAFLIKFSLMDFVGFRSPDNTAGLILVFGKFLPKQVG